MSSPTASLPAFLPASRVPDPASAPPLRWGILATGGIADKFVTAAHAHTSQQIVAVGSRSRESADRFAARHGIDRAHSSYDALAADPDVEAIYVATPHSGHRDAALQAIAAGKHVLVEKAFTRNAAEATEVIEAARAAGVMVMEAMWTRFLPHIDVVRQLLADGVLGEVSAVLADHGQYFGDLPATHRLLDPALAGGALLDLGIYPVSFASFALGGPDAIAASGTLTDTGVDAQVAATLTTGEAQAVVHTTQLAETPTTASISGSVARVELSGPFYAPASLTVTGIRGGEALRREIGPVRLHEAMCYEAAEFARCVRAGMTESPLMPVAETLRIMRTMDGLRRQVGVRYPGESA